MKAKKTPSPKKSDPSPAEIADIVPECPTAPVESIAGSPAATATSHPNLRARGGPCGDLDDEDLDFSNPFLASSERQDPFAGWVTPGKAPKRLPEGDDVNPDAGKDSEAIAREQRLDRQRIDRRNRERWGRLLDVFPVQEMAQRPRRWVFAAEIADLESCPGDERGAFYSKLARAVATSSFPGGVHWLPEEFDSLRADGLRHPQLKMSPSRIAKLAVLYSPDAKGPEVFDNPSFHREVVERLVISVAPYRQWLRDNGKPDLPAKFKAEVVPTEARAPGTPAEALHGQQPPPTPEASLPAPPASAEAGGEGAGTSQREKSKAETKARHLKWEILALQFLKDNPSRNSSCLARLIADATKDDPASWKTVRRCLPPTAVLLERLKEADPSK